ncbi:hypothetical protein [Methylorubrum extorquens]|uniref:Uncharacterized protein n=1 Tax=Methylorubrum extorquens (strain ATCC 14718 / DSM 1338 / JCM 2805 / NCIMB 9133 / AM1) TaxID=272630 RepID=C5B069_METEA|nr:hypothetical protein [Methylorubrum extorquens]ACS39419.1 Hypothetical protein MexAM1_META1p1557 [Methylorubrum extorquens AM1]MCP1542475.1 hypothetical protein [Methylorubrum extorquens]MCP1590180.1 hypothetical protein [Methylorubrum extorquens]
MARPPLPAGDVAAHRAWVAETIEAPFHRPRELARLVHPKAEKAPPAEKARDLVDMMEAPAAPAAEKPWYVKQGLPIDQVLRHHFGGAISPPSPLALKRAKLRRERAEAAIAARAAAQAAPVEEEVEEAPAPTPEPSPAPAGWSFTKEEAAAVRHLAWGKAHSVPGEPHRKAWEAFAARGAVLFEMPVPMRKGDFAKIRITETRLGFTSGYDYEHPKAGCGGGGYLDPQRDDEGWFLWRTRQAALQAAANELWTEYCDPPGKDVIRQHFASIGIDVETVPSEDDKRLLASHSTMADLYSRKLPRVPEQSLDALVEYERACGLTDRWVGLAPG